MSEEASRGTELPRSNERTLRLAIKYAKEAAATGKGLAGVRVQPLLDELEAAVNLVRGLVAYSHKPLDDKLLDIAVAFLKRWPYQAKETENLKACLREAMNVLSKREEGESDYLVKMIREALK